MALALLGVLQEQIDLVVSGINPNANIGHDLTYSGTVTAAMEAVIWGIPGIAVSLNAPEYHEGPLDFSTAARVARRVAEMAVRTGMPRNLLLNVNVPYLTESQLRGYRLTRQGLRVYRDQLVPRQDPRGRPYYWIGGEPPTGVHEEGTDFGMLEAGYVSITPLHLDLTDYTLLKDLSQWDQDLSAS